MKASINSAVIPGIWLNHPSARSIPSLSSSRVMISMSQPTSLLARRTFCPRRPIARDSWSSLTSTIARPSRG